MKYLSPEIEAMSKNLKKTKSLAKPGISCGIFQDIECKDEHLLNQNNTY